MSQAKVEKYKQEKANRKQKLVRDKIVKRVCQVVGTLVVLAILVGIGFGIRGSYVKKHPHVSKTHYVDLSPMQDYIADLED